MTMPADVREYPDAIATALTRLRLVGVNGPYSVLLGAEAHTKFAQLNDNGYPILQHIQRLVETEIVWAPREGCRPDNARWRFRSACWARFSIGYLGCSGKAVKLYPQETFTFLLLTTEASVSMRPATKT
jgi:uncharacterized linocin/CFP29 family protein